MNKNLIIQRAGEIVQRKLRMSEVFSLHQLARQYTYEKVYEALGTIEPKNKEFYIQLKRYLQAPDMKGSILDVISQKSRSTDINTMEDNKPTH